MGERHSRGLKIITHNFIEQKNCQGKGSDERIFRDFIIINSTTFFKLSGSLSIFANKKNTIFLCNLKSLHFNFEIGKFLYTCPPTSFGKNGACRLTHIALQKSASPIMQRVIHCRLEKLNFGRIDIVTQKPGNNRIKYQVRNTEEGALI